jgi:DNA-binding XRE family transcriptional regulator
MSVSLKFNERKLRGWMDAKGLTQVQLAEALQVSRGTVARMCTGYAPKLTTVENLARLMRCQLKDLLRYRKGQVVL